jgi:LDH2 family malate/lactate/ureidoglycolate dehydrogenase
MKIAHATLIDFVEQLFLACEISAGDAELCAKTYVWQEMRGVTTHGLRHVASALEGLSQGRMSVRPNRTIRRDDRAMIVIDGDNGLGIVACTDAMDRAISKAQRYGIGIAIIIRSNHFLAAAPHCWRAVEHGMVGICCTNTYGGMGYPGAKGRAIGNDPIGFGVPTGAEFPIIFDSALSTSGGKLAKWIREGKTIPSTLFGIDSEGNHSTDPRAVLDGGTPQPIGDHKGAGLAILMEVLTGVLGDSWFLQGVHDPGLRNSAEHGPSHCCICIDIEKFMPLEVFHKRMVTFIADLKANPVAPGHTEIFLPGERAQRSYRMSMESGVSLEEDVANELRRWAQRLKVCCPF